MDYKQKYKEALERARVWRDKSGMPKDRKGILDDIFPELTESEDEKIRKEILEYVSITLHKEHKNYNKWIAWLEKQKQEVRTTGYWNVQEVEHESVEPIDEDGRIRKAQRTAFVEGYNQAVEDIVKFLRDNLDRYDESIGLTKDEFVIEIYKHINTEQ